MHDLSYIEVRNLNSAQWLDIPSLQVLVERKAVECALSWLRYTEDGIVFPKRQAACVPRAQQYWFEFSLGYVHSAQVTLA